MTIVVSQQSTLVIGALLPLIGILLGLVIFLTLEKWR